jgi:hypothetical protein
MSVALSVALSTSLKEEAPLFVSWPAAYFGEDPALSVALSPFESSRYFVGYFIRRSGCRSVGLPYSPQRMTPLWSRGLLLSRDDGTSLLLSNHFVASLERVRVVGNCVAISQEIIPLVCCTSVPVGYLVPRDDAAVSVALPVVCCSYISAKRSRFPAEV